MELHNVKDMDVRMSDICEQDVKSKFSVSNIKPFESQLIHMITKAFGCKRLFTRSNSSYSDVYATFTLIGVKSNVEMCQYTCEVMSRKLYKARVEFTKSLPSYMPRNRKTVESDGFCMGWVEGVTKMIIEFANPVEIEQAIDAYIAKTYPKLGSKRSQDRQMGSHGFSVGVVTGSNETIYRGMNGQEQLRIAK